MIWKKESRIDCYWKLAPVEYISYLSLVVVQRCEYLYGWEWPGRSWVRVGSCFINENQPLCCILPPLIAPSYAQTQGHARTQWRSQTVDRGATERPPGLVHISHRYFLGAIRPPLAECWFPPLQHQRLEIMSS